MRHGEARQWTGGNLVAAWPAVIGRERALHFAGGTHRGHSVGYDLGSGKRRRGYPDYDKVLAAVRARSSRAGLPTVSRRGRRGIELRHWDPENDKPRMRRIFPRGSHEEIMAAFPGRSWTAISLRARAWNIRRIRPDLGSRGVSIIDSIIAEARRANLSVTDLNAMAGTNFFYKKRTAPLSRRSWVLVLRTIRLLGGSVRAR